MKFFAIILQYSFALVCKHIEYGHNKEINLWAAQIPLSTRTWSVCTLLLFITSD